MEEIQTYILPHWPFVAACLVFGLVGQVVKMTVFTKDKAKLGGWRWWGYKTLPLHPVFAGMAMSAIPGLPCSPGVDTWAAKGLYFALAGVCSTWAFKVVKQLLEKQGIDIDEGVSNPPPPTPPPA